MKDKTREELEKELEELKMRVYKTVAYVNNFRNDIIPDRVIDLLTKNSKNK